MQSRVDEASHTKLAPPRGTLNRKAAPRGILNVHHRGHRQESEKCRKPVLSTMDRAPPWQLTTLQNAEEGEGLGGNRKEREADEKGEKRKTEGISKRISQPLEI
ncbi:hypothetical protein V6N13_059544 [Hibiscus sabdariffa]|uniref:Uncharacterized protein n=1 Tax=Hibiscus sabdariffa TaxID=183260 RepID=A0ABR2GDX2_9ROSI